MTKDDQEKFKTMDTPSSDYQLKNILPISNALTKIFVQLNSTSPFEVAKAFIEKTAEQVMEIKIKKRLRLNLKIRPLPQKKIKIPSQRKKRSARKITRKSPPYLSRPTMFCTRSSFATFAQPRRFLQCFIR